VLWAEWGCNLEGSTGGFVHVASDRLRCSDVFHVLEVHSIVVVFLPSFVFGVVGVGVGVGVGVVFLVHTLRRGG